MHNPLPLNPLAVIEKAIASGLVSRPVPAAELQRIAAEADAVRREKHRRKVAAWRERMRAGRPGVWPEPWKSLTHNEKKRLCMQRRRAEQRGTSTSHLPPRVRNRV